MMKKILFICMFLIAFLLMTGISSAHRVGFSFGFFFAPPPLVIGPPVVVGPPPVYYPPPPGYYPPPPREYRYYEYDYPGYNARRVWVPSHWKIVETERGRERVYVQGHWEYRP
jgi:hypothetical protein